MCKPHKMGRAKRWTAKELAQMKEDEKNLREFNLKYKGIGDGI